MKFNLKEEKGRLGFFGAIAGILISLTIAIIIVAVPAGLRLDFESGSHRITPTAIDKDMWENYKVYFKTSEYTQNSSEDYYYIENGNEELKTEMEEYIKQGKTVIVYYDKYAGWKGFKTPSTAPITKIEVLDK